MVCFGTVIRIFLLLFFTAHEALNASGNLIKVVHPRLVHVPVIPHARREGLCPLLDGAIYVGVISEQGRQARLSGHGGLQEGVGHRERVHAACEEGAEGRVACAREALLSSVAAGEAGPARGGPRGRREARR